MQSNEKLLLDKIAKINVFRAKYYDHPDKKVASVLQDAMEILLGMICDLYLKFGLPDKSLSAPSLANFSSDSQSYKALTGEKIIGANFFGKPWSMNLTPRECDRIFHAVLAELKSADFFKVVGGEESGYIFIFTLF